MKIIVLAVGRMRNSALESLCEDYAARIRRYGHDLTIEEIKEEPLRSSKQAGLVLGREAVRIRQRLPGDSYSVALDHRGQAADSESLAADLQGLADRGVGTLAFIVGGHLGLDRSLKDSCQRTLSLSPMTFPHEMARLILLEQLYRANTIIRGEPYHK